MSNLFDKLRMSQWLVLTAILAVAVYFIAPEQLQVGVWKLLLTSAAAYVGYWLDRLLFPYARPHEMIAFNQHIGAACLVRRAIIMAAVILGVALAV